MAKKSSSSSRQPLVQAPPPANSSSSFSSSEENSSSSSDEEDNNTLHPQTQTQSINKLINNTPLTPKPHVSDSSDESSESDTDTDTPPPPPSKEKEKPIPKPQVSKAESDTESDTDTDTPLAKVKSSKPKPTIAALPSVKASATASASTAKKGKGGLKEDAVPGTPGKALFQRLFSEEDEIAILKGMIEYKEKKGKDPTADGDGFTRFIVERGLDVVEVKKDQLVNKVKRLKKKFETAKKKKKISGAHDVTCFELSKKIWGSEEEEENGDVVVVKKEKKKGGENVVVKENGGEREEWRGVKRCESGGGGEKRKKGVKEELEEEILRLGEVQWSEMAGDVKYLDEETSVEVLERVKRRRVRKLEGMLEDLDEMRFVTLKAIESYKASLKK